MKRTGAPASSRLVRTLPACAVGRPQDAGGPAAWKAAFLSAVLALAVNVGAQDTTTTTAPPEKKDSALVEASKQSKTKPKTSRMPITNADVKKAKGKLVVLPAKPPLEQKVVDPRSPLEKQDQDLRERKAAELAVGSAEKKVGDLEKELNRIEQSFYDENDATYRDDVIQKRFDQAKRQLDVARKELADARDQLARFTRQ